MRIHITIDDDAIDGYFWACPRNLDFGTDFGKLNQICKKGQATEIYAPDFIDYVPIEQKINILKLINDLTRIGGKITIGGLEPYLVSKHLSSRMISLIEFNNLLFKRSASVNGLWGIDFTKENLKSLGYKITDISIGQENLSYTISAIKT